MTTEELTILISTVDNEIHEKQLQLRRLQAVALPPVTGKTIVALPKALPPFVPPPSSETIYYVRKILQSRKLRDNKNHFRQAGSIGKGINSQIKKNIFHQCQASRVQTRIAHQKREALNEDSDLQLVAQIYGLRQYSQAVVRKLKAIRRKEELSRKQNENKAVMESKRATVPRYQPPSGYFNCFVSCMSPEIPDALHYVQLTSLINPWTIIEKFHFLRLYLRHGKDFKTIASLLTFKSVHDCVRLYYSHKLHFGLSGLLQTVKNGEVVSDEEIMALARKGVITKSSVQQNTHHQKITPKTNRSSALLNIQ